MALQDSDVFIVSDTSGTNYKVSYTDLIAKLQADGVGGGGGMGNIIRFYNMTHGSAIFTHGSDIPPDTQHIAYNTTATYGAGNTIELHTYKWGFNSYVVGGSTQYGTLSAVPKDVTKDSFMVYVASRITSFGECTISY